MCVCVRLIQDADVDGSGAVTRDEFEQLMEDFDVRALH